MKPKTRVKIALSTYLLITFIIVLGHTFFDGFGFHFNYTISRYIGLSFWSAILFLLTSIFIFWQIIKYIKTVKDEKRMGKLWWIVSIVTVSALIGVGLCPLELFDSVYGEFGLVSILHRAFSGTMFCLSIIMVLLTALKFLKSKSFLVPSLIYIIYGLFFVVCYSLNLKFFFDFILIFEAIFLTNFYIIMLLIPNMSENKNKTEDIDK